MRARRGKKKKEKEKEKEERKEKWFVKHRYSQSYTKISKMLEISVIKICPNRCQKHFQNHLK